MSPPNYCTWPENEIMPKKWGQLTTWTYWMSQLLHQWTPPPDGTDTLHNDQKNTRVQHGSESIIVTRGAATRESRPLDVLEKTLLHGQIQPSSIQGLGEKNHATLDGNNSCDIGNKWLAVKFTVMYFLDQWNFRGLRKLTLRSRSLEMLQLHVCVCLQ